MSMKLHLLIQSRREALGLTDTEVAQKSGLSIHEYSDVEQHENELFTVTNLHQVRRLVHVLGLTLEELIAAAGVTPSGGAREMAGSHVPRNVLIKQARQVTGLSPEQLADVLGYDTDAVDALESDPTFLEDWSLELVVKLAQTLRIPIHRLLLDT